MAGSKRWFPYTCNASNGGTVFGLEADESNTEAVNEAETELPDPSPIFAIPKNLSPRHVVLRNSEGATRTCYVLTPAKFTDINLNESGLITGFTVVRKNDEKITRSVVNIDTGQTDGDTEGGAP